jgi:hypothetical protein
MMVFFGDEVQLFNTFLGVTCGSGCLDLPVQNDTKSHIDDFTTCISSASLSR